VFSDDDAARKVAISTVEEELEIGLDGNPVELRE
jgi:hypothetical protein